jgi:hypothetical protein
MKKVIFYAMITVLVISLHSCASRENPSTEGYIQQSADSVTYQQFYDALGPYGQWIDYPGFGYVWSPGIPDFSPYVSNGFWVSTNLGWCWNSGYSWGWAPFHYGRWFYETGYGWLWVPGYEWAPAWVMWRTSPDYYGWAPLPPGINLGVSVGITIPYEHWTFVDHRYLTARDFRPYIPDVSKNEFIYKNTTIINNFNRATNNINYAKGPDVTEVERFGGQKINTVNVRELHQSTLSQVNMDKGEMNIYKPSIRLQQNQGILKPANPLPYQSLTHNNGRRGTWSMPATTTLGAESRHRM